MIRIAVLVSGGGTNLQALINAMQEGKFPHGSIELVLSSSDTAYALERAAKAGIETAVVRRRDYVSQDLFDLAVVTTLKDHDIDMVVLAGYLSILGPAVIQAYPERILNIHPSLIPSFCGKGFYGLKVHEEALKRGVKVTGATVHYVNEIPDGGRILIQKPVMVQDGDTPEILQKRVMEEAEWIILPEAVRMVSDALDKGERV
ncbi:MAG: phosphoribosylglycinamide formyltransferase [Solobacterium sp.]|nr:phosphoribosylglycinamide formyltransferase [Solobacterium sp.]